MIDTHMLAAMLGKVKHFQDLTPTELETIIRSGIIQRYAASEEVFAEGSPCAGLLVLLSGRVQICKHSTQGQVAILSIFDPVIMFNEVAALDHGANPATAIALEDTLVWRIDSASLEALVLRHPRVGLGMLRVLAGRNRVLVEQFHDLSFHSVLVRTAKLLVELSNDGAVPIDRRKCPNHQLAARIATVPEAFSRSLKVFKNAGDINCSGKLIFVLNPQRLREVAQDGEYDELPCHPCAPMTKINANASET